MTTIEIKRQENETQTELSFSLKTKDDSRAEELGRFVQVILATRPKTEQDK